MSMSRQKQFISQDDLLNLNRFKKGPIYHTFNIVFTSIYLFFIVNRGLEILNIIDENLTITLMLIASTVSLLSIFLMPPKTLSYYVKRIGLVFIILGHIKSQIDKDGILNIKFKNLKNTDLKGKVALIINGHDKLSIEMIKFMAEREISKVVTTCPNQSACERLSAEILPYTSLVEIVQLNLSDLEEIKSFTISIKDKHQFLNFLILNLNHYYSVNGEKTVQGHERHFTEIYYSGFLFIQNLLPLLRSSISISSSSTFRPRILTIGNEAFAFGNFGSDNIKATLARDVKKIETYKSIFTFPYFMVNNLEFSKAKLGHLLNIQKVSTLEDKLDTVYVNPGSWDIFISNNYFSPIFGYMLQRPLSLSCKLLVYGLLDDSIPSGSYIDSMGEVHDLMTGRDKLNKPLQHENEKLRIANMEKCIFSCGSKESSCITKCKDLHVSKTNSINIPTMYLDFIYPSDDMYKNIRNELWLETKAILKEYIIS